MRCTSLASAGEDQVQSTGNFSLQKLPPWDSYPGRPARPADLI